MKNTYLFIKLAVGVDIYISSITFQFLIKTCIQLRTFLKLL